MAQRNPNKRIMGNRSRSGPGSSVLVAEVQGVNVLSEHFWALSELVPSFAVQLLDVTSDIGIEHARELVRVDTGTTRDSINKSPGVIQKENKGEWSVRYGPTTFYAPFLEYGTRHMHPYPFMIPSGDLAEKVFFASVLAFLDLFDTDTGGTGFGGGNIDAGRALSDPRVRGSISGFRSFLYSQAKFLGDVSVFGGRGLIGPLRSKMYLLARSIGDVTSIVGGTLGMRISRRLSGRTMGRIVGYGSASLSFGKTYSAFPGGEGGRRVYQRVVGRTTNIGFSGLRFGGMG